MQGSKEVKGCMVAEVTGDIIIWRCLSLLGSTSVVDLTMSVQ